VYLLSGQLIFAFFNEATNTGMQGVLENGAMIKKVYLPKYIFPFSSILSCFTTMVFSLVALFIVMIATGTPFHGSFILVPIALLYILAFAIGVGIMLSALLVFFRDLNYLWGVFMTALNYLTPIFYPVEILPEFVRNLIILNPLFDYINFFRKIVLYGKWPTIQEHAICIGFALFAIILGGLVFKNKQKNFILYI
jgi:ABC-type polysaccharide/polyol phosphate export permease